MIINKIEKVEKRKDGTFLINGIYWCSSDKDQFWDEVKEWGKSNKIENEYECPDNVSKLKKDLFYRFGYKHTEDAPIELKQELVRQERDKYLRAFIDIYQGIRYDVLSDQEKNVLKKYRKDLLDIPQQKGFPDNIIWPELPKELSK